VYRFLPGAAAPGIVPEAGVKLVAIEIVLVPLDILVVVTVLFSVARLVTGPAVWVIVSKISSVTMNVS
jgi:hypothetical protein